MAVSTVARVDVMGPHVRFAQPVFQIEESLSRIKSLR
jgi:hypothetical protein